jgi:hypothetical protein
MDENTRRDFLRGALSAGLLASLLGGLRARQALARSADEGVAAWLEELNALSARVSKAGLSQAEWRKEAESLFARLDLAALRKEIDFERPVAGFTYPEQGGAGATLTLPGLSAPLAFGAQLMALKKGRALVPHGHDNMLTAHILLEGKVHGRTYDRVADEKKHLQIQPVADREFGPGEITTISDAKENVHWFIAASEPVYIFNTYVLDVRSRSDLARGMVFLDPEGEALGGGVIRARRLDMSAAFRKFG